jgi:hypothetical protein
MAVQDEVPPVPAAAVGAQQNDGPIVSPEVIEMVRVGVLGLLVGLLVPFAAWLLQKFMVVPVFCHQGATLTVCGGDDLTTYYIASVVVGIIAVTLMANWQVFRPLLVAAASASALWGLQRYLGDTFAHSGWEYYISSALAYGTTYLLFYWLLRFKSFALSVVTTIIAIVLIRWALLA